VEHRQEAHESAFLGAIPVADALDYIQGTWLLTYPRTHRFIPLSFHMHESLTLRRCRALGGVWMRVGVWIAAVHHLRLGL